MNQKEEIKTKSKKANEIVATCKNKLGTIRKKQNVVIEKFHQEVDTKKMENIKKHIEAL